ncbi:hypothetical protein WJX81_005579 [Elliptochloris bilobata]|uniref:Uncharacterized protein n=1 Tax=Elliptochloris bilobata TaxID=381761 RepID=A0AAW1SCE3_9CHLO
MEEAADAAGAALSESQNAALVREAALKAANHGLQTAAATAAAERARAEGVAAAATDVGTLQALRAREADLAKQAEVLGHRGAAVTARLAGEEARGAAAVARADAQDAELLRLAERAEVCLRHRFA